MLSTRSYDVNLLTVLDVKKFRHVFVGEFEISDSSVESLLELIFRRRFTFLSLSLSLSNYKEISLSNQSSMSFENDVLDEFYFF